MWYENGMNWLLNLVPFLSWNSFTRKLKVSSSLEESTHSRSIQLCWMCRHLRDNFRVFLFYFHFPHCPLDISVCHHTIHVDYPLHLSRVILLTPSLIPEESKKVSSRAVPRREINSTHPQTQIPSCYIVNVLIVLWMSSLYCIVAVFHYSHLVPLMRFNFCSLAEFFFLLSWTVNCPRVM